MTTNTSLTAADLQIDARPFRTPCAACGTDENIDDYTPTFASNADGSAVCDACVSTLDHALFDGLTEVRELDATYWRIVHRDGEPSDESWKDANTWLRAVLVGAFGLFRFYGSHADLEAFLTMANRHEEDRLRHAAQAFATLKH